MIDFLIMPETNISFSAALICKRYFQLFICAIQYLLTQRSLLKIYKSENILSIEFKLWLTNSPVTFINDSNEFIITFA